MSDVQKRILIVDDDDEIRDLLEFDVRSSGYFVDTAKDGLEGLNKALNNTYDLILLDVMMPKMNGFDVCKNIRQAKLSIPILMLTAKGTIEDKTEGFDCGADDYLVKPFDMRELLARVRALVRRPAAIEDMDVLSLGDINYMPATCVLSGPKGEEHLSKRLASLVTLFMRNTTTTLSRNTIFNRIWGPDADVDENILDTYIGLLRRRLKKIGSTVQIKTNRGVGYSVEIQEDVSC